MTNDNQNIVEKLIEESNKINSNIFNLTRFTILALTSYIKDGIQYRELKTLLNISDGKLKSNLDTLLEMGYLKSVKIELDRKDMHIYIITDTGNKELSKIIEWIEIMKKMVEH